MTELGQIRDSLGLILRKLAALEPKRAPLTRAAFATAVGLSYKTICRKVDAGEIKIKDGRIPASELDSYLT
jgi:hypothetical protein